MKGFGSRNEKTNKSIKTADNLKNDQLISKAFSLHSNGKIEEASEIYNFLIQNKIYDSKQNVAVYTWNYNNFYSNIKCPLNFVWGNLWSFLRAY